MAEIQSIEDGIVLMIDQNRETFMTLTEEVVIGKTIIESDVVLKSATLPEVGAEIVIHILPAQDVSWRWIKTSVKGVMKNW